MKKFLIALLGLSLLAPQAGASVTVPYSFSAGTTISSSQVNANFSALMNELNAHEALKNGHYTGLSDILAVSNSCGSSAIDFNENYVFNFRVENVSANPAAGNPGRLVYNTGTNSLYLDNGTSIVQVASSSFPNWSSVLAGGNSAGAINPDFNENQALHMRLENLASDPVAGNAGRVWFNSTSGGAKLDTGAVVSSLLSANSTDTLTNKSISGSTNTLSNIPNSATTAASANTASAIVSRDASGNFSAGTVTANLTGNVTGNVTGNLTGAVTGNASTASALASLPTSCSANTFATTIAANGNLTCSSVGDSALASSYLKADGTRALTANWNAGSFNITASTFIGALTGNASTATALASVPTGCTGGQFATGIAANGNLTCGTPAGAGNVTGPVSSTDKAIAIYSGTTGQTIQNSTVTVSAANTLSGVSSIVNGSGTVNLNTSGTLNFPNPATTDTGLIANGTQTMNAKTVGDSMTFVQQSSAPANPSAGRNKLWWKNDGRLYTQDSGGTTAKITVASDLIAPTIQKFDTTARTFTVTSANATQGATYTNNSQTFTVIGTISGATSLNMTGTGAPLASGTLTKATGTGDPTITFSAVTAAGGGTYTTPAGVLYFHVRMVGGGGGGGGSGTAAWGSGGSGGNSTFGTTLLVANGGAGATGGSSGFPNGGTASLGAGPMGFALSGANGQGLGASATANVDMPGGNGGSTPFGGAGNGASLSVAGASAVANSGSGGGGGGGSSSASAFYAGAGGAAGGFVDAIITSPSATYSYAVGAGGTLGAAGTGGFAGGAGGSGAILVEEHYQ